MHKTLINLYWSAQEPHQAYDGAVRISNHPRETMCGGVKLQVLLVFPSICLLWYETFSAAMACSQHDRDKNPHDSDETEYDLNAEDDHDQ